MGFARFMATPLGRMLRVLAGLAMIYLGFWQVAGIGGVIVGVAGFLPLAAGALNFCAIGVIIGAPFWGKRALQS